jgi:hypothetical protein
VQDTAGMACSERKGYFLTQTQALAPTVDEAEAHTL